MKTGEICDSVKGVKESQTQNGFLRVEWVVEYFIVGCDRILPDVMQLNPPGVGYFCTDTNAISNAIDRIIMEPLLEE